MNNSIQSSFSTHDRAGPVGEDLSHLIDSEALGGVRVNFECCQLKY